MSKQKQPLYFVAPLVVVLAIVYLYPVYFAIRVSLFKWLFTRPDMIGFNGLDNYARALTDKTLLDSLVTTIVYTLVSILIVVVWGFLFAYVINRKRRGRELIRARPIILTVLTCSAIIAPAVIGGVFRVFIWDPAYGLANYALSLLGIAPVGWLVETNTALLAVVLTEAWLRVPLAVLILDAGIRRVPPEPFEAARIEGASALDEMRFILIPLIKPQLFTVVLFQLTFAFRQFDLVFMLTGGGPANATNLVSIYIYKMFSQHANLGYASAMAVVVTLVLVVLGLIILALSGRPEERLVET
jgi:multiple sugar transport system permease protein